MGILHVGAKEDPNARGWIRSAAPGRIRLGAPGEDQVGPPVTVCGADGGLQVVTLTTDAAALADWTPTDIVYPPFSDRFTILARGHGLLRWTRAL
jgi:hypothetical protein